MATFALSASAGIVVYPEYDARIERDWAYAVRVVQGGEAKRIPVYNHCEKSALTNRTRGGDVNRRFCEFAFSGGPVRVDIMVCEDVKSYAVFPTRLGLRSSFQSGVISVEVDRPCNFGIRLNDYDKTILSVFADAPEDPAKVPVKDDPGILYVEGWMDAPGEDGVLIIESPIREVYIAPGAVLNARVVVKSEGAYIHGRGMVLDPMSDIFRFDQRKNTQRAMFRVTAPDVTVEDIKLIDSRTFNFTTGQPNITLRNVKALSSMMCSDGITSSNKNLTVDGAWLYVGDNGLVVSGLYGSVYRNVAIGTSCNALFPQFGNENIVMENIDVFRADEGFLKNTYNGALRRNVKWDELSDGAARKPPSPRDLTPRRQSFFFRNLSAVDCVLFSRFFVGGNMGTLEKLFGFENVAVPWPTGRDHWDSIGQTDGPIVNIFHDSARWLDSGNYTLAITNLWMGGERLDEIPQGRVVNAERVKVSVVNTRTESAIPAVADRHEVNWVCPSKCFIGAALVRDVRKVSSEAGEQHLPQLEDAENLLVDRPNTRSAWQRCPSWMAKLDAMETDGGARVYRLTQCERNAGMLNIVTDALLRHGNGTYHLSFEARAKVEEPVLIEAHILSNETQETAKFTVPNDGAWHKYEADVTTDFDLSITDLVGVFLKSMVPADELCFKNLSLVKVPNARP